MRPSIFFAGVTGRLILGPSPCVSPFRFARKKRIHKESAIFIIIILVAGDVFRSLRDGGGSAGQNRLPRSKLQSQKQESKCKISGCLILEFSW